MTAKRKDEDFDTRGPPRLSRDETKNALAPTDNDKTTLVSPIRANVETGKEKEKIIRFVFNYPGEI